RETCAVSKRFAGGGWIRHLNGGTGPGSLAFCRCRCDRQRDREPNRKARQFTRLGAARRRVGTIARCTDANGSSSRQLTNKQIAEHVSKTRAPTPESSNPATGYCPHSKT